MKKMLLVWMLVMVNAAMLQGCEAVVGGAAGAAIYDEAEDEL